MDKEKKLIDYLYRDGRKNMSFATEKKTPGAKKAILSYKLLEEISDNCTVSGYRSLVRIQLETGRHHQIRVQMSHAELPLIGDRKYNPKDSSGLPLGLCSCCLSFCIRKQGKNGFLCDTSGPGIFRFLYSPVGVEIGAFWKSVKLYPKS